MPSPVRLKGLRSFKTVAGYGRTLHVSLSEEHPVIYVAYSFSSSPDAKRLLTTMSNYVKRWVGIRDSRSLTNEIEEGNSILVNVRPLHYVYVGREVYTFKTKDEIVQYVSPEGGAKIPFSIAFTPTMVYFLHERRMVSVADVLLEHPAEKDFLGIDALELYRTLYKQMRDGQWDVQDIPIESRML